MYFKLRNKNFFNWLPKKVDKLNRETINVIYLYIDPFKNKN